MNKPKFKKVKKIPIAWTQYVRFLNRRLLPILVYATTAIMCFSLWTNQSAPSTWVGQAEQQKVLVSSIQKGVLAKEQTHWPKLWSKVEKGQLLAVLDSREHEAKILLAQQKLQELQAELSMNQAKLEQDREAKVQKETNEIRRTHLDLEKLQLQHLSTLMRIEIAQIEFSKLDLRYQKQKKLQMEGVETSFLSDEAKLKRDAKEKSIEADRKLSKLLEKQVAAASDRLITEARTLLPLEELMLSPFHQKILLQQSKVKALQGKSGKFKIYSPCSGTILEIHLQASQSIKAGQALFTIGRSEARKIIAYVTPELGLKPEIGQLIQVESLETPPIRFQAKVAGISGFETSLPETLLKDPKVMQHGQPISIDWEDQRSLRPGQLLRLSIITKEQIKTKQESLRNKRGA